MISVRARTKTLLLSRQLPDRSERQCILPVSTTGPEVCAIAGGVDDTTIQESAYVSPAYGRGSALVQSLFQTENV